MLLANMSHVTFTQRKVTDFRKCAVDIGAYCKIS